MSDTSSDNLNMPPGIPLCLFDDLLDRLQEANSVPKNMAPDRTEERTRLLEEIFDDWDVRWPENPHPGRFGRPHGVESAMVIGTFSEDLPPVSGKRKEPESSTTVVPPHRKCGALAYMRPSVDWDELNIKFKVLDGEGRSAPLGAVNYAVGLTMKKARAKCVLLFDENEASRINWYNTLLVLYWARNRIIKYLFESLGPEDSDDEETIDDPPEILDELVEFKEARGVIDWNARVANTLRLQPRTRRCHLLMDLQPRTGLPVLGDRRSGRSGQSDNGDRRSEGWDNGIE